MSIKENHPKKVCEEKLRSAIASIVNEYQEKYGRTVKGVDAHFVDITTKDSDTPEFILSKVTLEGTS